MTYVVDATNVSSPLDTDLAQYVAAEIRAIKVLLASTIASFFTTGVQLPFYNTNVPAVGWTNATVQNDSMMRVVSAAGSGGTSGNAAPGHSPILNSVVPVHTHGYSGTTGAENGNHTHYDAGHQHIYALATGVTGCSPLAGGVQALTSTVSQGTSAAAASLGVQSAPHGHGFSGTTDGGSSSTSWQPRYMDFCIGRKT